MISKVKVLLEMNAFTATSALSWRKVESSLFVRWVVLPQRLKHSYFNFARITILLHRSDNLDGNFPTRLDVSCFDYLAECALTKEPNDLV